MDKIENPPGTNPFPFGNCKSPRGLTHFCLGIENPPGD